MRPVRVSVELPLPPQGVWEEVSPLDRHPEWMADARSVRFTGEQRSGVGTRVLVDTAFGPLRTLDTLVVTEWEPGRCIGVEHRGLFTGWGRFLLEPVGAAGTRFTWEEQVRFPWYFGGPLGALVARPAFRWMWRRNLERLRSRLSAP